MAKTVEMKLQFGFEDEDRRDLKLGPFAAEAAAVTNAKTNIKAFDLDTVAALFLSDGGANCTGIKAATLYESEEADINLN